MGNRTEGRTKRKSVKANVTSKFSSKRKLSRMGKKVKKGKAGPSTEFITRSAALRKLQITLKDFRRLCILKGIYPRVPTKPLKGADKVYYDIKDISYIMNEPLLERFRQFKAFMKKIRRAAGRNQFTEARRVNDLKPRMVLDHLVKERYPRFIDAVRDLDDCLCMIHLFAALPSVGRITADRTSVCSKLAREWQYFVSKSKALRKVFVSVKGIYYQAEVMGESISWLVPHAFTQHLPSEVDFRVMLTFLEFYEIFFKFVLYKLYASQGWQYPPVVDERLDHAGSCLLAMKSNDLNSTQSAAIESNDAKKQAKSEVDASSSAVAPSSSKTAVDSKQFKQQVNSLPKLLESLPENDDDDDDEDDGLDISAPLSAAFSDLQRRVDEDVDEADREVFRRTEAEAENSDAKLTIFSRLTFFINREVPLTTLQMCITAFGGRIGWDGPGSPFDASSTSITHHVIDRPMQVTPAQQQREFIQPQWVFDCINAGLLLPTRLYAPGTKLPPHLSPFVDDEKEGYLPRYREEVQKLQVAAGVLDAVPTGTTTSSSDKKKTQQQDEEESDSEEEDDEDSEDEESDDEEGSDEEEEAEELMEIPTSKKAAANGKNSKSPAVPAAVESKKGPKAIVQKAKVAKQSENEEVHELAVSMMSKKTKRLYDKMQYGINEKQEGVKKLETKRRLAEEPTPASSKKQQPQSKKQRKA